jgi:hypothetical protein
MRYPLIQYCEHMQLQSLQYARIEYVHAINPPPPLHAVAAICTHRALRAHQVAAIFQVAAILIKRSPNPRQAGRATAAGARDGCGGCGVGREYDAWMSVLESIAL